jgi:hypothetical protein
VLTPDQRQRILAATGVTMESIFIDDASGMLNAAMVTTQKEAIEAVAMREAMERKAQEPAKQAARRQVNDALAALEAQGGAMAEQVAKLKQDPKFLATIDFDKKKK